MAKILARLLPLLLLVCIYPGNAGAQQPNPPGLNLGDAVVTGFSGTLAPAGGKSAIDRTFINPDGPSARVIALGHPGFVWDGRLFAAPKSFDVLAKDVGQVFGVAIDDARPPNIYLAATSVFGLNIVRRGRDGQPERRKKGGPGVGWMKGQFGLELQGGPGAIYKVDGRTGGVSLFANVTLDGVPNPAPGLGNLAYDSAHKQLFVSDLYTGMIHRFALDGRELDRFDHGVTALTAAKLAPHEFNPRSRPNIASERFNSGVPDTWGYAPAARRVWALAVHDGRLFYSARNGAPDAGPQIWSVGIAQDGGFAGDPRWELDVPAKPGPYAVSDIAFTQGGAMILAQRAPSTGAYNYVALTHAGEPRVLRYRLESPDNPNTPSHWIAVPEEYAIGLAGDYRNGNGGVALGYGYGPDGILRTDTCEAALWSSGQNLRNNPAMRSQLEPGGPLAVNGLQGSPADLVRNANAPPMLSYFVDYDGKFNDARATGHMGSVRILTKPCAGSAVAQRAAPPVNMTLIGKPPRACTPTCICPPGTELKGKECVKVDTCPPPQVMNQHGECVCPNGSAPIGGACPPLLKSNIACKPPMILDPLSGHCVCPKPMLPGELPGTCMCPNGTVLVDGQCVPPPKCDPPLIVGPHGTCICPQGGVLHDGKCVPQVCPPPMVPGPCVDGTPIDLGIEKTGGTSPPIDVPWYGFHITVTNHGPGSTPGGTITVTDVVPAGMNFTSVSGTGWTCTPASGGPGTPIVCTYGPATNAGDVLPVIDITAQAIGNGPFPPFTNCAVVAPKSGSDYTDTDASNNQACVTVSKPDGFGRLSVTKHVASDPRGIANTLVFPVTAMCTNPTANYTMVVHNNTSSLPINVPVGSVCTFSEALPALPKGCTWNTPSYSPTSVTIGNGLAQDVVTNGYTCDGEKVCPPPQILNVDNICVCPPPMLPGAAPGLCTCPDGEVLVNGKCVREKHPKTCKRGYVLKDGECVKREHSCKRGYVWNGDMCVRRKIERDDERRDSPGVHIPGGGGSFPRGGGGGATGKH